MDILEGGILSQITTTQPMRSTLARHGRGGTVLERFPYRLKVQGSSSGLGW